MTTPQQGPHHEGSPTSDGPDNVAGVGDQHPDTAKTRPAWGRAARRLAGDPAAIGAFTVVTVLGLLVYRVWLPLPSVTYSIALSVAFGVLVTLQVHAFRHSMRAQRRASGRRGALGGLAFVVSCLPCFIGLTPTVPALLTALGVSAATASAATASTRHWFMSIMPALLAASLVLLVAVVVWTFVRLAGMYRVPAANTSLPR